jgi:REP element-mobilizing transposase RayT
LTIPHRGTTTPSTYFVTANVLQKKSLFHVEKIARFFIEVMLQYRTKKKYLLHEFVVMPDHFHLIRSSTSAAEADFFSSSAAGINACSTP